MAARWKVAWVLTFLSCSVWGIAWWVAYLTSTPAVDDVIRMNHYAMRGVSRSNEGDLEGAILDFSQALALVPQLTSDLGSQPTLAGLPGYDRLYFTRGYAYHYSNRLELALADYNRAIASNAYDHGAYFYRGIVYSNLGRFDLAMADFQEVVNRGPITGDNFADNYVERACLHMVIVAWLLKDKDGEREALDALKRYVDSHDSMESIRSISRYYLGEASEKAVFTMMGNNLSIASFYLGMKQWREGNRSKAVEYFTKGVETTPPGYQHSSSHAMLQLINDQVI